MERSHEEQYQAIQQQRVKELKEAHFGHPNYTEIENSRKEAVRVLREDRLRYIGQMLNLEEHITHLQGILDGIPDQIAGVDQQLLDLGEMP